MQNRPVMTDLDADNGQMFEGEILESKPPEIPTLSPKEGIKTSQGQLTIIFGLVAVILSMTGLWKGATADKIDNIYQTITQLLEILGPVLLYVPVLINYINSRGKIQSNALWASASLSTGVGQEGTSVGQPAQLAGIGNKISKGIQIGRAGIEIGKMLGVPGTSKVGQILEEVGIGSVGNDQQDLELLAEAIREDRVRITAIEKRLNF